VRCKRHFTEKSGFHQEARMLTSLLLSLCAHLKVTLHPTGWLELRLARPAKLNALSAPLVEKLCAEASRATTDAAVAGVLLTAEPGRAFCAGGDVCQLAARVASSSWLAAASPSAGAEVATKFLSLEYSTDLALHALSSHKPVVALADGIAFGAGAGLLMASSLRVVTPRTVVSMPEASLGIVADCGALDFLTRHDALPLELGLVCALSGARLAGPAQLGGCGLATHACATAAELEQMRAALIARPPHEAGKLLSRNALSCEGIEVASLGAACERAVARAGRGGAAAHTFLDGLEQSLAAKARTAGGDDAHWLATAAASLESGCPAAQLVALDGLRRMRAEKAEGRVERRALALGIELVANALLAARRDFAEGVACAIGERKGETPRWAHSDRRRAAGDTEVQEMRERVARAQPLAVPHALLLL
jgi:enoyl-CoA hydratase/carnithine racemase